MKRFWIYQRERFPLLAHGGVIAAFSCSAIGFSAFARHASMPAWWLLAAGFFSSLLFFMQLRIADEWKDAAEDARYRPYRPVPRGLVTLRELAIVGFSGAGIQLAIALAVAPRLVPLLAGVWIFFGLMSREFFISRWLRAHPVAYILSHMLIMPLIDAYVSAFDWLVSGASAPHALGWFLAVTFCNGLIVEIGRKIRAPGDEEEGVETYSVLWGRRPAALIWCSAFALTVALAIAAAQQIRLAAFDAPVFAAALAGATACAVYFIRQPLTAAAKRIEDFSAAWTVGMYGALGLAPFALRGLW